MVRDLRSFFHKYAEDAKKNIVKNAEEDAKKVLEILKTGVIEIELDSENPKIMFVTVFDVSGNKSTLWKETFIKKLNEMLPNTLKVKEVSPLYVPNSNKKYRILLKIELK